MILLRVILVSLTATGYFAEDIVPVRTGSGPTPKPGGNRRKDPTADLPDLSRDELLAILDLIEKSGGETPEARTVPPRYPSTTTKPLYPSIPSEKPFEPLPPTTSRPFAVPSYTPTEAPTSRPSYVNVDPDIPPNYPAPIAPPMPASTTPKPKKSFFDKLVRGFMKIVAPQTAGSSTKASPGAFLNSFLTQLQEARQSNPQQQSAPSSSSAAVLNNLLQRLQGQNSEGSQFVTNLVQTLQANSGPSASNTQPTSTGQGDSSRSTGEQLLASLLKGITSGGQQQQQGAQQGGGFNFAELLQRELFKPQNSQASEQSNQKSTTDLLLNGFKQVLQQANNRQ